MEHLEPLRDEGPPRTVQVRLDDARWVDGQLELLWEWEGICWALIRYPTNPCHTGMGWFDETRIQRSAVDKRRGVLGVEDGPESEK